MVTRATVFDALSRQRGTLMRRWAIVIVAVLLAAIAATDLRVLLHDVVGIARGAIVIVSTAAAGLLCVMLSFESMRERFRK